MNKNSVINFRVDEELKDAFQTILSKEGYSMSEVIEGCMKDIVRRGFIPINIKSNLKPRFGVVLDIVFIKKCLQEIMETDSGRKVNSVSLFGSYSKGKATPASDVDLFIETDDSFTLFDLSGLKNNLEKALGKSVDLIAGGNPEFLNHIRNEKIQLYEKQT